MPDVAPAGAEGRHEVFPSTSWSGLWAAPGEQRDCEKDDGERVQGEDHRHAAQVGDDQPGQCRSDRHGHVDAGEIQSGRRPQLCPGYELGDGSPPGGEPQRQASRHQCQG